MKPSIRPMAMAEAIIPLTIALPSSGLVINHRVAPTICIVFIIKRLLYIASLIVLSMDTITKIDKIMATTSSTSVVVFTNWLTPATVAFGV